MRKQSKFKHYLKILFVSLFFVLLVFLSIWQIKPDKKNIQEKIKNPFSINLNENK